MWRGAAVAWGCGCALTGCGLVHGDAPASCPTDRTVVLASQDDVVHFAGCERASGVTIRSGATLDLAPLHELAEITGDLTIGPTVGIDEAAFTGLRRVGGAVHVSGNGSLVGLFLPRLEHAGRVIVDGNASLTTVSLPHLVDVDDSLVITDSPGLELIDATALTSVGNELVIGPARKLTLLELPLLARVQSLQIDPATALPAGTVDEINARIAR
jgi:hypothetical protein